jgi:hypothetical protein
MQGLALGEPFNGDNIRALSLRRQHGAGFDSAAIEMDRATTALTGIATDMRTRQSQVVAQQIHQQSSIFNLTRVRRAVNSQCDFVHGQLSIQK